MWRNTFPAFPSNPKRPHGRGMYFYEPLKTSAPAPDAGVKPYCCYTNTIVFYKYPYQPAENGEYQEWDRIETAWDNLGTRWTDEDLGWDALAPLVLHEEKIYEVSVGEVIYHPLPWLLDRWCVLDNVQTPPRWYMRWQAWRVTPRDWRWQQILETSMAEWPPIAERADDILITCPACGVYHSVYVKCQEDA